MTLKIKPMSHYTDYIQCKSWVGVIATVAKENGDTWWTEDDAWKCIAQKTDKKWYILRHQPDMALPHTESAGPFSSWKHAMAFLKLTT